MENENRIFKIIKYVKIILFILVIIILLMLGYIFLMKKINMDRFTTYLNDNGYKKQDDGYYLKIDKSSEEETINYKAFFDDYVLSKELFFNEGDDAISVNLGYTDSGKVEIDFQLAGFNSYNSFDVLYQTGTYKNGKFECKVVSGKYFESHCSDMKRLVEDYDKDTKKILKENKINPIFLR